MVLLSRDVHLIQHHLAMHDAGADLLDAVEKGEGGMGGVVAEKEAWPPSPWWGKHCQQQSEYEVGQVTRPPIHP